MSKIVVYNEKYLFDKGSKTIRQAIKKWSILCESVFGVKIPLGLADRKQHHQLKDFSGELNTAYPGEVNGDLTMVLYLEPKYMSPPDDMLVTHELGHWIAKLQEFPAFKYKNNAVNDMSIYFNSFLQHPVIYKMQRQFGLDPTLQITDRLAHTHKLLQKQGESIHRIPRIKTALLIADDWINSKNDNLIGQITSTLEEKHRNTLKLVQIIIETATYYDICHPSKNLKFANKLIRNLKMQTSDWALNDDVEALRKRI